MITRYVESKLPPCRRSRLTRAVRNDKHTDAREGKEKRGSVSLI